MINGSNRYGPLGYQRASGQMQTRFAERVGPRTVPVRSGLSGLKPSPFSRAPRPAQALRTGTVRGPFTRAVTTLNRTIQTVADCPVSLWVRARVRDEAALNILDRTIPGTAAGLAAETSQRGVYGYSLAEAQVARLPKVWA